LRGGIDVLSIIGLQPNISDEPPSCSRLRIASFVRASWPLRGVGRQDVNLIAVEQEIRGLGEMAKALGCHLQGLFGFGGFVFHPLFHLAVDGEPEIRRHSIDTKPVPVRPAFVQPACGKLREQ
jgi:hypothetical protein